MGDELVLDIFAHVMADALRQQAAAFNISPQITLEYQYGGILQIDSRGAPIKTERMSHAMKGMNFMILGGGSLLEPVRNIWAPFCKFARLARLPVYLHATGTQLRVTSKADMSAMRCIRHYTYGGLRGPITAGMLRDLAVEWTKLNPGAKPGVDQQFDLRLPIISDSGMLAGRFFPRHAADIVTQLDRSASSAGVICISGLPHNLDEPTLVRTLAAKYSVVLMPVDYMTYLNMTRIHGDMISRTPELRDRVFINKYVTHYGVWLALLDRCSIMLTSRLHAMILSASVQARFRIFDEPRRSQLKLMDFLNNTFGEALEPFKIPSGFRGTLTEVDRLLAEDTALWQRRYGASYERRAIAEPYEAHVAAMSRYLMKRVLPEGSLQGAQGIRVRVDRRFDGAVVHLMLR